MVGAFFRPAIGETSERKNLAAQTGTKVVARRRLVAMANTTVIANGVNKNFPIPERKMIGKNTTLMVTVTMVKGRVTSIAASRAASNGDLPRARCRWVFSKT